MAKSDHQRGRGASAGVVGNHLGSRWNLGGAWRCGPFNPGLDELGRGRGSGSTRCHFAPLRDDAMGSAFTWNLKAASDGTQLAGGFRTAVPQPPNISDSWKVLRIAHQPE